MTLSKQSWELCGSALEVVHLISLVSKCQRVSSAPQIQLAAIEGPNQRTNQSSQMTYGYWIDSGTGSGILIESPDSSIIMSLSRLKALPY